MKYNYEQAQEILQTQDPDKTIYSLAISKILSSNHTVFGAVEEIFKEQIDQYDTNSNDQNLRNKLVATIESICDAFENAQVKEELSYSYSNYTPDDLCDVALMRLYRVLYDTLGEEQATQIVRDIEDNLL